MSIPGRYHRITALAAVLLLGTVDGAFAQQAALEGVVRTKDGDAPVQFALVRLVRGDSTPLSDGPVQGLTSGAGRYRFGALAPGRYRVQLLRIGFVPVVSDAVDVAEGETREFSFRVAWQAVVLPPVTVTAELCVPAKDLDKFPQIQTLWQQARDGASVRTELMARFRYDILVHEETIERKADGSPAGAVDQRRVNDPKSAVQTAARYRGQRLSRGYYGPTTKAGVSFYIPSELDILHQDFLNEHCLVPGAEFGVNGIGLRFQPLRARSNLLDIGGTIWLDSATFLARRIDLEYVDGDERRGTVRLDFGDVSVAGGTLRLPVGGEINLRPSRTDPEKRTETKLTMTYTTFEEARRR
jgi:hypothetical protein